MKTHIFRSLNQRMFCLVILFATFSSCSSQSNPPANEQLTKRLRESVVAAEGQAIEYSGIKILEGEYTKFRQLLQSTTVDDLAVPRLGFAFLNPVAREDKALFMAHWIADEPQADAVRLANNIESIDLQISMKEQKALLQESVTVVVYATAFWPKHSSEQWANIDRITQSDDCRVILLKNGKEISEPHPIIRLSGDE